MSLPVDPKRWKDSIDASGIDCLTSSSSAKTVQDILSRAVTRGAQKTLCHAVLPFISQMMKSRHGLAILNALLRFGTPATVEILAGELVKASPDLWCFHTTATTSGENGGGKKRAPSTTSPTTTSSSSNQCRARCDAAVQALLLQEGLDDAEGNPARGAMLTEGLSDLLDAMVYREDATGEHVTKIRENLASAITTTTMVATTKKKDKEEEKQAAVWIWEHPFTLPAVGRWLSSSGGAVFVASDAAAAALGRAARNPLTRHAVARCVENALLLSDELSNTTGNEKRNPPQGEQPQPQQEQLAATHERISAFLFQTVFTAFAHASDAAAEEEGDDATTSASLTSSHNSNSNSGAVKKKEGKVKKNKSMREKEDDDSEENEANKAHTTTTSTTSSLQMMRSRRNRPHESILLPLVAKGHIDVVEKACQWMAEWEEVPELAQREGYTRIFAHVLERGTGGGGGGREMPMMTTTATTTSMMRSRALNPAAAEANGVRLVQRLFSTSSAAAAVEERLRARKGPGLRLLSVIAKRPAFVAAVNKAVGADKTLQLRAAAAQFAKIAQPGSDATRAAIQEKLNLLKQQQQTAAPRQQRTGPATIATAAVSGSKRPRAEDKNNHPRSNNNNNNNNVDSCASPKKKKVKK